jgi:3-isopropylmalate/(R)-2-methylmalate dehydratase large subunit
MNGLRSGRTIIEKIFDAHAIHEEAGRTLLYVDRLIAADTALPAFNALKRGGYRVRRPSQSLLIPDHFTPSSGNTLEHVVDVERRNLIRDTNSTAQGLGIQVFDLSDLRRGIQHVVSTEQAYAQPGVIVVAADSHTSTQGAVGALAFSIGTDFAHVLATQCVWLKKPRSMRITLEGKLAPHVTVKDIALALIANIGSTGASGMAVEFAGGLIRSLSVEARMTVCNMSVEMGARLAIVAPDSITFDYLNGRAFSPSGFDWGRAIRFWQSLASDLDANFEREYTLDVSDIGPMVTWGNNAENAVPITARVPDPALVESPERKANMLASLEYMGLTPLTPMTQVAIDQVFIGSCANSTIEDIRAAARVLSGRKVVVPTLVVPGSGLVKEQAEAEGLADIFVSAGATWAQAGCSMCNSMNGDVVSPGARCASTSNRNHMGRQGPRSRTHLVSPPTAAATAVTGRLADLRELEGL